MIFSSHLKSSFRVVMILLLNGCNPIRFQNVVFHKKSSGDSFCTLLAPTGARYVTFLLVSFQQSLVVTTVSMRLSATHTTLATQANQSYSCNLHVFMLVHISIICMSFHTFSHLFGCPFVFSLNFSPFICFTQFQGLYKFACAFTCFFNLHVRSTLTNHATKHD